LKHKKTFSLTLLASLLLTIYIATYSFLKPPIPNASATETIGPIGIYWNQNCTQEVHSINWGTLTPGAIRKATIYVRNEGNETYILILTPENWNPSNAPNYLDFSWNCDNNKIQVGKIAKVTLNLLVLPDIAGITEFSFDIIFEGREPLPTGIYGGSILNVQITPS
jgi:hypothetical protein